MLLYHGSNVEVKQPQIIAAKRLLDLGSGFYMTTSLKQAEQWAVLKTNMRVSGTPIVSVYEVDINIFNKLSILKFSLPDQKWLEYVAANRTGQTLNETHDIVIGPVANLQTVRIVNDYIKGYLPADIAIRLLSDQKLKDQYNFKTEIALKTLNYMEARPV